MDNELKKIGFFIDKALPFVIDQDLPNPADSSGMSTYTVNTDENKRLRISGPILMSWYSLIVKRQD